MPKKFLFFSQNPIDNAAIPWYNIDKKRGYTPKKTEEMKMMNRAYEIAQELKASGEWIPELCEELCELAGMADEWAASDGETFEQVLYKAAEALNVEII